MRALHTVVFDLDGTISEPAVGIGRSINYALERYGFAPIAEADVSRHIGPPLDVSFKLITGSSSEQLIADLVAAYRERYAAVGYAENVLYDGIPEALARLVEDGARLGVCTSKRVDFAEQILTMFGLRSLFEFVSGGDIGVRKQDQLAALCADGSVPAHAFMVGDRAIDIMAARANELRSVAVLWGHGSEQELSEAGPMLTLRRPQELEGLIARTPLG